MEDLKINSLLKFLLLTEGLVVNGQKVSKTFPDIVYTLNAAKTEYTAPPIVFSIQLGLISQETTLSVLINMETKLLNLYMRI